MKVYHGSDTQIEQIDLNKCKLGKDFGQGFYVTKLENQARTMAERVSRWSKNRYCHLLWYWKPCCSISDDRLRSKRIGGNRQILHIKYLYPTCRRKHRTIQKNVARNLRTLKTRTQIRQERSYHPKLVPICTNDEERGLVRFYKP